MINRAISISIIIFCLFLTYFNIKDYDFLSDLNKNFYSNEIKLGFTYDLENKKSIKYFLKEEGVYIHRKPLSSTLSIIIDPRDFENLSIKSDFKYLSANTQNLENKSEYINFDTSKFIYNSRLIIPFKNALSYRNQFLKFNIEVENENISNYEYTIYGKDKDISIDILVALPNDNKTHFKLKNWIFSLLASFISILFIHYIVNNKKILLINFTALIFIWFVIVKFYLNTYDLYSEIIASIIILFLYSISYLNKKILNSIYLLILLLFIIISITFINQNNYLDIIYDVLSKLFIFTLLALIFSK